MTEICNVFSEKFEESLFVHYLFALLFPITNIMNPDRLTVMPMIGIPQKIGLIRGRKITSAKIIGKPNLVRSQPQAISLFILGMFFFGTSISPEIFVHFAAKPIYNVIYVYTFLFLFFAVF